MKLEKNLAFIIPAGKAKKNYLVLNDSLEKSADLMGDLIKIRRSCRPQTRVIIRKPRRSSLREVISVYLAGAGLEITRLGNRYIIARPDPCWFPQARPKSLTICITVRNEKGNIEPLVRSIPQIAPVQEILFIEGHSTDGTRQEILRVIKKYPAKNIRVMGQPGIGQGDATRVGFKAAKGEIIIIYEGDGTSDPGDIVYFYEAMKTGRFEFIEGTRFVYPKNNQAMPLVNQLGNILFAKWFSFFLGQKTTDVLSGIKAILKRDYEVLYRRWGFLGLTDPFGDFELLYGAARMGLKIGEIPIRYYPRTYGVTKTKPFTHGLYLLRMAVKGYLVFRKH